MGDRDASGITPLPHLLRPGKCRRGALKGRHQTACMAQQACIVFKLQDEEESPDRLPAQDMAVEIAKWRRLPNAVQIVPPQASQAAQTHSDSTF